jgi:Zn-dependent protease
MMKRPLLVFEDTAPASRRELFRFLGVTFMVTRYAAFNPITWISLGVVTALAQSRGAFTATVMVNGLIYGVFLICCAVIHTLGHIAAGHLVGAPMDANLLTATRDVNIYVTHGAGTPRMARIGRSLGGPLANLLAGLVSAGLWRWSGEPWLLMFGVFSGAIGVFTLMPIPTLDGSTILKQLLRRG